MMDKLPSPKLTEKGYQPIPWQEGCRPPTDINYFDTLKAYQEDIHTAWNVMRPDNQQEKTFFVQHTEYGESRILSPIEYTTRLKISSPEPGSYKPLFIITKEYIPNDKVLAKTHQASPIKISYGEFSQVTSNCGMYECSPIYVSKLSLPISATDEQHLTFARAVLTWIIAWADLYTTKGALIISDALNTKSHTGWFIDTHPRAFRLFECPNFNYTNPPHNIAMWYIPLHAISKVTTY